MTYDAAPWQPHRTDDGSLTLRCPRTGALAHSEAGAWSEAWGRYAEATRLPDRARAGGKIRLLDVGTGLGWNLAAALWATRGTSARLEVLSLELDGEVVRQALSHHAADNLGQVEPYGPAAGLLTAALEQPGERVEDADGHGLTLLLGDGRETLPAAPEQAFDLVFLDPFAPAQDPPLWEAPFLAEVARRMGPGALLSTYTASLAVRTNLAAAGLRVGQGPRLLGKAEGTLASPDLVLPELSERTARKLARRLSRLEGAKEGPWDK